MKNQLLLPKLCHRGVKAHLNSSKNMQFMYESAYVEPAQLIGGERLEMSDKLFKLPAIATTPKITFICLDVQLQWPSAITLR